MKLLIISPQFYIRFHPLLILVDCEWDEWEVGDCSKSCGVGSRVNVRTVKVNSSNGGKDCQGLSNIQENCNIFECPGT